MNLYIWRHNKKFHSYSMISEPCINNEFYTKAIAVVTANSKEEAIARLAEQDAGWRPGDLELLEPEVCELTESRVLYTLVSGN